MMKTLVSRLKDRHNARLVLNIIEPVFVLVLMSAITAYLVDGSFNPFLLDSKEDTMNRTKNVINIFLLLHCDWNFDCKYYKNRMRFQ